MADVLATAVSHRRGLWTTRSRSRRRIYWSVSVILVTQLFFLCAPYDYFRAASAPPGVSEVIRGLRETETGFWNLWYKALKLEKGAPNAVAELTGITQKTIRGAEAVWSAVVVNTMWIVICFCAVGRLRKLWPVVYANNVREGGSPVVPDDSYFGWLSASYSVDIDDVAETRGLDAAMFLEFTHLAMKILVAIGVPLIFILCPLHYYFGDVHRCVYRIDPLVRLSIGNLEYGNWVYAVHAVFLWYVVVVVQQLIFIAQAAFLRRRIQWLKEMPAPRVNSVLVENIPHAYRSDKKLWQYFDTVFARPVVSDVHVVKQTGQLNKLIKDRDRQTMQRAMFQAGADSGYPEYTRNISDESFHCPLSKAICAERDRINRGSECCYSAAGFVTFKHRRDAQMALKLVYTPDDSEFIMSRPPDPCDVIYEHLQVDPPMYRTAKTLSTFCIIGLFVSFCPIIVGISSVLSLNTLRHKVWFIDFLLGQWPTLSLTWDSMMSSVVLNFFTSYFPTFLVAILRNSALLKSDAWCQVHVQQWYYAFLVLFVLLVTTLGSSLFTMFGQLVDRPGRVFSRFASTMPTTINFYFNYCMLQSGLHAKDLLRYVNLTKFLAMRPFYDEARARAFAEPEDQDYYGIGARSARETFMLVVILVFSTISPLICLFGLVHFAVSRAVYGYLMVFAESRKPDLGGVFWVSKLRHLQAGLFIFAILMTGILCDRAETRAPGIVGFMSLLFLVRSWIRFGSKFRWKTLPFEDFVDLQNSGPRIVESYAGCDTPRKKRYDDPVLTSTGDSPTA